jgi:hypothetical protein
MINRRQVLQTLAQFFLASPLLKGQIAPDKEDPLLGLMNVFDFAKLAKDRLDPVA